MSFNQLSSIATHSFVGLRRLDTLHLDDNRLNRIEKRAFMNLEKLKHLSLRGNKLNHLAEEVSYTLGFRTLFFSVKVKVKNKIPLLVYFGLKFRYGKWGFPGVDVCRYLEIFKYEGMPSLNGSLFQ